MAEELVPNPIEAESQEQLRKSFRQKSEEFDALRQERSSLMSQRESDIGVNERLRIIEINNRIQELMLRVDGIRKELGQISQQLSHPEEQKWKQSYDPITGKGLRDEGGHFTSMAKLRDQAKTEMESSGKKYTTADEKSEAGSGSEIVRTDEDGNYVPPTSPKALASDDQSEKIVPYQKPNESIINIDKEDLKDDKIEPSTDNAPNESITLSQESSAEGIEPYRENLDLTLADINPEDIVIDISKEDLEPSPDLPDYKKEALRFINELAKRDQERAIDRYGGFKPFSALSGALRVMSAAKVPFTKWRPFAGAAKLAEPLEKIDERVSKGPIGRAIGKIRGWFDRVGQRKTLTEEQIANDQEIDQNLAQVGNFSKNKWWKKPLKVAGKVMGGFGVAGAMVMTGGVGAATALLWAGGLKEGYDGMAQTVEQVGWGRKRAKAELETQTLLSQAVDQLKSRLTSGEQITADEYARLTEEILQREERLMATQEMNVFGERKGQKIRSVVTSALTVGTGLFAGVPMGKINYDIDNTALAETYRAVSGQPNIQVMEQAHRGFWNILHGGQFGYGHENILSAVKDTINGASPSGAEYNDMQYVINYLTQKAAGNWSLTTLSPYGQTSHILGQGLALADKLKIGAAGAYLLGETFRHYQGGKTATPEKGIAQPTGADKPSTGVESPKDLKKQTSESETITPLSSTDKIQRANLVGTTALSQESATNTEGTRSRTPESSAIEEISNEDSEKILNELTLNDVELNSKKLTTEQIKEFGLSPRHKITAEGKTLWFSENSFSPDGRRNAGLVYFEKDGKFSVLPYVLSSSQSIYRLYPGFTVKSRPNNGREYISWYSKGSSEQGLMLPVPFQKSLAELSNKRVSLNNADAELVLVGSSNKYANNAEAAAEGAKVAGVLEQPEQIDGISNVGMNSLDGRPGNINFADSNNSPDFSRATSNWQSRNSLYGNVRFDAYNSKNGRFRFLFCQDDNGRAWVAGIEDLQAPIGNNGLRTKRVEGGALLTPAYEYADQLKDEKGNNYGNASLNTNGNYVDAYKNLLSRIPVIQEYQRANQPGNESGDEDEEDEAERLDIAA